MALTKSYLKDLTYQINGAAIVVHKFLGPGLLESIYHKCLKKELDSRGISFTSELLVPINFKGLDVDTNLRCDLFIENCIVLELKTVDDFAPIHQAQLLTYMKLLEAPKGILYNFNSVNLYKEGQMTLVNEYFRNLED
ncbi:GxxExxY protein [Flavobacterium macrobrachii]|uniref:GxxExxY protein n=1 Tax=Flavobacterium macrobrachii TaxID=591204 RepID=A0ABS2D058_9FLAO|nr:GxxExxY protein [Flavobacterium macrobrachii]MBM6500566.1 GxxExxY protein [Flavobacterium macrobrachii]